MSPRGRHPEAVYCVPAVMGGMLNIVAHLLAHRDGSRMPAASWQHRAVLVHNPLSVDTPFDGRLAADRQDTLLYRLPRENLYSALRRLARLVPAGPGVLVSNDWLELAMLYRHDPGKAVIQILHGDHDYYYHLAVEHRDVIDAHVAYSRTMHEKLLELMPERRDRIFHLPYGIPLPRRQRPEHRTGSDGKPQPLRLLFAGRLQQGQKGIFDLPEIDRHLARAGVEVRWTLIGAGPDEAELARRWQRVHQEVRDELGREPAPLEHLGVLSNEEVVEQLADHDLFVLPTRAEGFPVALLEAMGAALVPVVSDIESGVPEVVTDGVSGLLPPMGDTAAFAAAIGRLAAARDELAAMSRRARIAAERYDIGVRIGDYLELYGRWGELYRPKPKRRPPYGSRLDQPWLPNPLIRGLRWLRRTAGGRQQGQAKAAEGTGS